MKIITILVLTPLLCLLISSCQITPKNGRPFPPSASLVDGIYEASFKGGLNEAKVAVTISDKKVAEIKLLEHNASWIGRKADTVLVPRMIKEQSANVDAVSGATNSSNVIMNAVQLAVEKAIAEPDTGKLF